ncbi:B3 domain-containing protein [Actinidia chinensis var. chinensis]|uniref:B3 domain-containing protein n=1 Tax=Actinidia chinensis var. chinensis TaxID=1590841 RepID=A0A2R6QUZ8_ACTCC|nr:B3 domain-containing protein [Actinidia chinensis var. chinensis]
MKDNSEANNNNDNSNGVGNNNLVVALEEPKENYWDLVRMALSTEGIFILDDETSSFLNSLKTQFLGRKWINGCVSFKNAIKNGSVPEMPELGKPIDGFTPPKLPPVHALEGLIGECGVPFEQQLTETDMNKHRARLLIAQELVEKFVMPFMSEEERRSLKCGQEIQVTACGSNGIEYPMTFKCWGSKMVLTSGWNEFRIDNEFKALQDWVTMWVFRHKRTSQLCFGMIARRFPTNQLIRFQKKKKGEEMNK